MLPPRPTRSMVAARSLKGTGSAFTHPGDAHALVPTLAHSISSYDVELPLREVERVVALWVLAGLDREYEDIRADLGRGAELVGVRIPCAGDDAPEGQP
jgi:hypothetical protein